MYQFATVLQYEEPLASDELYPRLDEDGKPILRPGEEALERFEAAGLVLYRGGTSDRSRFANIEKTVVDVLLTDRRLIVLCDKFSKGGGFVGFGGLGVAAALTANAVSKARSAVRRRGKVLAGQMWLQWIAEIAVEEKQGLLSRNAVWLAARDSFDNQHVLACLVLSRTTSSRDIGQRILDATVADGRRRSETISEQGRRQLEAGLAIPPYTKGKRSSIVLHFTAPTAPDELVNA